MVSKKRFSPSIDQNFPVVGIGASAGGLDAFKSLLKAIPENSGIAYVIVQHLDPSRESILPDILSRITNIPVIEITDAIQLVSDHIYVIPSNQLLISKDGTLKLTRREGKTRKLPINIFFKSLAEVYHTSAVGIVLSGTGSDGTEGLKAIKEYGGLTFAQEPQSAAYDEMPRSAINAKAVDFILPPEEIPWKIIQIMQGNKAEKGAEEKLQTGEEAAFKQIIFILRQHSGVDFTYYKQSTMCRRMSRRMAMNKNENLTDYLKFLRSNKAEQDALFQDVLIPVTSFFRDPEIFQTLNKKVFPAILKNKITGEAIRMWSAGCSTGQEAFSLAISIREIFGDELQNTQVQIFASDVSGPSITKARKGIYHKSEFTNTPDSILKKYFIKNNDNYQVNRQIRDMCIFAVHNFLKDPPFANMDLISCRNVLIYMNPFLQKKALTTFHYALKKTGFLLLGKSETTSPASELFSSFAKNEKIYLPKLTSSRFMLVATERKEESLIENAAIFERTEQKGPKPVFSTDFRKSAESVLLSKYTPAGVIINEQADIVHIHGVISPFLEPSQGKPTFNLFKMAREGLAFEMRNVLHKVKNSNSPVIKEGVPVRVNKREFLITIEIIPLTHTVEPHYLILFRKTTAQAPPLLEKGTVNKAALKRIDQLEKELEQTREDMRSITEDQEAINEELQSANEELLSSNEEMQSLNEEMETSKEELQSTNEELIIVNQELLDKQEQIHSARNYAEAIIATLREPLIVLDSELRIEKANDTFLKKFNLSEREVIGRKIYEIGNELFNDDKLRLLLEKTLPKKIQLNDYEVIINLPSFGNRIMILNAWKILNEKNDEKVIILAFEDITERKTAEERRKKYLDELESAFDRLQKLNDKLEDVNKSKDKILSIISHDLRNPLTSIVASSNIMMNNTGYFQNDENAKFLKIINNSSNKIVKQLDELVEWSKQRERKISFNPEIINLYSFVIFSEELIEDIANQKNITIENNIDKRIEVKADSFLLRSIFQNLITNSIKFTPKGGKITISASQKSKLIVEISIKDTGIGMTEKDRNKLFSEEGIISTISGKKDKATGLGLLLVKDFVEKHNGKIWIESDPGKGTTIYFTLPGVE